MKKFVLFSAGAIVLISVIYLVVKSYVVPNKEENFLANANLVTSVLGKDDSLIYISDDNIIIKVGEKETILDLPNNLKRGSNYELFLSEDKSTLYYLSNYGKIMAVNIDDKRAVDLLEKVKINISEYISTFYYDNDKIIALLKKDKTDEPQKLTNKLLEINLKYNSYKIISLPFVPYNIDLYNGLSIIGENYLLCHSDSNQVLSIINNKGEVIKKLPIDVTDCMVNIKPSKDGKYFTYQLGLTPTDLYLYDIEKEKSVTIHYSKDEYDKTKKYIFCFSSSWSKEENSVYYLTQEQSDNKLEYKIKKYSVDLQ